MRKNTQILFFIFFVSLLMPHVEAASEKSRAIWDVVSGALFAAGCGMGYRYLGAKEEDCRREPVDWGESTGEEKENRLKFLGNCKGATVSGGVLGLWVAIKGLYNYWNLPDAKEQREKEEIERLLHFLMDRDTESRYQELSDKEKALIEGLFFQEEGGEDIPTMIKKSSPALARFLQALDQERGSQSKSENVFWTVAVSSAILAGILSREDINIASLRRPAPHRPTIRTPSRRTVG